MLDTTISYATSEITVGLGNTSAGISGMEVENVNCAETTKKMYLIGLPVFCILGVIGNALSVIIAISKRKRKNVTLLCIGFLGLADTTVLFLSGIHFWLLAYTDGGLDTFVATHCFVAFAVSTNRLISNLTLVAVSVLRFIYTWFPYDAKSWCSMFKIKWMLFLIFICSVGLNSINLVAYKIEMKDGLEVCGVSKPFKMFYLKVWLRLYSTTAFILPATLITLLNSLTIGKLLYRRLLQRTQVVPLQQFSAQNSSQTRTTVMLIVVSMWYVVSLLPFFIYLATITPISTGEDDLCDTFRNVSIFIMISNNVVNFYIYTLVSREYRHNLVTTFKSLC